MACTRTRTPLSWIVAVALFAAGCGGDSMSSTLAPSPTSVAVATDSGTAASDGGFATLGKGSGRGGDEEKGKKDDDRDDEKDDSRGRGGSGSSDDRDRKDDDRRGTNREDVSLSGFVSAVTATTLTVRGTAVGVTASTRIRHGNRTLTIADIHVGDHAQVKGVRVAGVVTATEVKVEDTGDDEDDLDDVRAITVVGPLAAVGSTLTCPVVTFTVGAYTVTTSASTRFTGAGCAALTSGLVASVRLVPRPDGTVLVERVSVEDEDDDADEAEGLTSAPSGACPALTFRVGTATVVASAATVFSGVTCAQVASGVAYDVEVKGTPMPDGTLSALTVELDD